jgi:transmembrane sensor
MLDYTNYRPEEFAADQSFRNWKLADREEDRLFWTEWLARSPHKRRDIEKATLLLEAIQESFDHISESEIHREVQRLAGQLDTFPTTQTDETDFIPPRRWLVRPWQVAAATLLCLMSLGWWFFRNNPTESPLSTYSDQVGGSVLALTEVHNTTPSPQRITLADGSLITLQPSGKLSYQPNFTGPQREVYLSGEAFFEVARNPEKPFLVYAEQLVTKVLGTSFTIKANPGEDQIQVLVKSGRVSVYSNRPESGKEKIKNEVVLKPNQQVVFLARENQFARSLIEAPELLDEIEVKPSFVFKATPIREVFEKLGEAYGIEITFDEEVMKNCYLTGSFTDEPLFEKLDLITRTLNASYQQVDGQIVITSRGC